MTVVSSWLTSTQNSKGNIGSEGAEWDRGRKTKQFLANKSPYLRNGASYDRSHNDRLIGSRIRAFDWYQNHRPWMTLNGQNALCWRKDAYFGAHWQIRMTIDSYCQQQKCRPLTLVSGNIRCMRIFTGVPLGGGVRWEWGCQRRQFLAIWIETSEIRPATLYDDMLSLVSLWLIAKWMT